MLGSIPHIPDSAVYYRKGILLSHGQLYAHITDGPSQAFVLLGGFIHDGKLYFHYNSFWPLLLAVPIKFGFAELLNPALSALSLLLIYHIAKRLYNQIVGYIASLFYCLSPFTIIMAGEFMMHTATQLFLLIAFYYLLDFSLNKKYYAGIFAGAAMAYALNLRPLTAIGVLSPIALYFLIFYREDFLRLKALWFFVGFIPVISLYFLDNYMGAGNVFLPLDPVILGHSTILEGILSMLHFQAGINYADSAIGFLPSIIFYGSVPMFFISLTFIPLLVYRKKEDSLLMAIFISLFVAYMLTFAMGIHGYGPRYVFEAIFALFILAARGVIWIVNKFGGAFRKVIILCFILLLLYNLSGLIEILPMYKNYNDINSDLFQELKQTDLNNSIVLIPETWNWYPDGITATLFDPSYKKVIFIKELPNNDHYEILQMNLDRKVYRIENHIVPVNLNLSVEDQADSFVTT